MLETINRTLDRTFCVKQSNFQKTIISQIRLAKPRYTTKCGKFDNVCKSKPSADKSSNVKTQLQEMEKEGENDCFLKLRSIWLYLLYFTFCFFRKRYPFYIYFVVKSSLRAYALLSSLLSKPILYKLIITTHRLRTKDAKLNCRV